MTSIENLRKLKALRGEKISLHESWMKCNKAGDELGMRRYRKLIKKIDKEILAVMDGE